MRVRIQDFPLLLPTRNEQVILRVLTGVSGALFVCVAASIATSLFAGFEIISPSFSPDGHSRLAWVAGVTCVCGMGLLVISAIRPPVEE